MTVGNDKADLLRNCPRTRALFETQAKSFRVTPQLHKPFLLAVVSTSTSTSNY